MNNYTQCLEKAGAEILNFKEFNTHDHVWQAFVKYNGQKGIVQGIYGSASPEKAYYDEFTVLYDCPLSIIPNGLHFLITPDVDREQTPETFKHYLQCQKDFGELYLEKMFITDKDYFEHLLMAEGEYKITDKAEIEHIQWAINQNW